MPEMNLNQGEEQAVARFHQVYYDHIGFVTETTWRRTYWMGTEVWKLPLDLWIYQELIHLIRPRLIVETGTFLGGSALFLAHLCDLLGQGAVVTVDVMAPASRPVHPRITYLQGSSTDPAIVADVRRRAAGMAGGPVMVILDSDHRRDHVLAELRAYHGLVTPGSYIIVEDSNINGHPVFPGFGPGPMEAVQAFLGENQDFEVDRSCEKLLVTFNPAGYLRKRGTPVR